MTVTQHHAVVYEGDRVECLALAHEYVRTVLNFTIKGSPDFEVHDVERFTIDDARKLKERAGKSPFGVKQVFIISSQMFLREAQNALLKLFEEPAENTHFIILVPSIEQLLPTVRSRLQYGRRVKGPSLHDEFVDAFLFAPMYERLKLLKPLIENKERTKAREILETLEKRYREKGVAKHARELKEIMFVSNYITDKASSPKMLLEHLAVSLPRH